MANAKRALLLEVGTEELPASFVEPALEDLTRVITERLAAARLAHGAVQTFGTPRRLAVRVAEVAEKSEDVQREQLGPSAKAAFGPDGKPTQAAEKFAQSLGLTPEQLTRTQTAKGEYVSAKVEEKGRAAEEILKDVLHAAVHGINFKKSMRWGDTELAFARPVHWIVALLGEEVLPVILGDVKSARQTYGHRFLAPGAIELKSPAEYETALEKAHVIADLPKRKAMLRERVQAAAKKAGGTLLEDESLIDQVTNLVELPSPVVGTFEERHLDLPPEVLVQEMRSHQRYFSLQGADGKLLPKFIAVSNTPVKDEALSLRGYQRVLRARLSDGRFFFDEDRQQPLAARLPKLERVVWQGKLGSYAEKVARFKSLALWLAQATGNSALNATIERGAELSKADLVTGMVGEFPELQGVMGREYALASGEKPEVAKAIFEHYLPRTATDALPTENAGALIGLADRLDSLSGLFAIGKPPTGAADPFGLRRACLAIINITLGRGLHFSLEAAIAKSLELIAPKVADVKRKPTDAPVAEQVKDFFRGRLKALWSEEARADVVDAVLAAGFDDLVTTHARVKALGELVGRPDFAPLAAAFKRVANIVEKQAKDIQDETVNPALLQDEAEKSFHAAVTEVKNKVQGDLNAARYREALATITSLKPAIDTFFDKVMVMAEDPALRANRVRLLNQVRSLFSQVADFAKIQSEAT